MPYTTEGKAMMLTALRNGIDEISIHTAEPDGTGSNEVSGGDYDRADSTYIAFTAVSGGAFALDDDVSFSGPANGNALFFGIWDNGDFLGYGEITGDTQFNSDGAFTLLEGTSFDLNLICE
jgi:hypothetical protein